MKLSDISNAIEKRLGIKELNAMQKTTASISLPAHLLLLAPTGSGKTLSFAIPFLRSLRNPCGQVQGVIIAPTRELVLQINDVIRPLAQGYKTVAFYGGHSMNEESNSLTIIPDIIIATPGRLLDHLQRGQISLHDVSALVLDEYDKSLELGFRNEMKRIAGRMKNLTTVLLTSATDLAVIPDFIPADRLQRFDFRGKTADVAQPRLNIAEVESPSRDKLETLVLLLKDVAAESEARTLIFVNHRESAERVYSFLKKSGFTAGLYHGGLEQQERERALIMFNNGTTPVLVSTDLASRGLDIADVRSVIHYHIPLSAESWTHRNGRAGRMGSSGNVYVLVSEADNIPGFVSTDHAYTPSGNGTPAPPAKRTLHINAGKKEKISRGDIAGYLIHKGSLQPDEVGTIDIKDHFAYVAVPAGKAREVIKALQPYRLKNVRVRVTQIL